MCIFIHVSDEHAYNIYKFNLRCTDETRPFDDALNEASQSPFSPELPGMAYAVLILQRHPLPQGSGNEFSAIDRTHMPRNTPRVNKSITFSMRIFR